MYYEESDTPAMARTSNLNEELGQVLLNYFQESTKFSHGPQHVKSSILGKLYRRMRNEETLHGI